MHATCAPYDYLIGPLCLLAKIPRDRTTIICCLCSACGLFALLHKLLHVVVKNPRFRTRPRSERIVIGALRSTLWRSLSLNFLSVCVFFFCYRGSYLFFRAVHRTPHFFFVVVVESPDIHGHVSSWPSARSYYWDISFSIYRLLCRLTLSIPESSSTKNLGRLSIDRAKIALPRTYAFGSLGGERNSCGEGIWKAKK